MSWGQWSYNLLVLALLGFLVLGLHTQNSVLHQERALLVTENQKLSVDLQRARFSLAQYARMYEEPYP